MKKIIFIAVLLLGTAVITAQGVRWGVTAGVNFSNVTGDDADNTDTRTGINIGGLADIEVSEDFSVIPEARYSMRGFKDGEFTFKIDYIEVPVVADYEVVDGLGLQAGPLFGFVINDEIDGPGVSGDINNLETFNFGFTLGAKYEFNNGFFVRANYDMGFTDVASNFDARNCNINLNLGYMFDRGGGDETD